MNNLAQLHAPVEASGFDNILLLTTFRFSPSQERVSGKLEFTKLWLFDNAIGDTGAAALAALVHPALLEVHLSHNSITTQGESASS